VQQQIQFIQSPDGVGLAVATCGAGTPLIIIPGWISHLELEWGIPLFREFVGRLAEDHLVVRYDKRGTGLSDRDVSDFSPEANLRDFEAIVDGLGLRKPAIMGYSQGGPISITYAVEHPDNVSHLIIYGSYHDGTTAYFNDLIDGFTGLMKADWGGFGATAMLEMFVPGVSQEVRVFFAEFQRQAASAEAAIATMKSLFDFTVTDLLSQVKTPTLVLHRRGDKTCPFQQGREMAARIPGARFVPLEGDIHVIHLGDIDPIVNAIQDFVHGGEGPSRAAGVREGLQTILFTDLVGSTELTQRLGDAKAQELLREHNEAVRNGLKMLGGSEIKHTGDGIMASFPSAFRAITCAQGIQAAVAARNETDGDNQIAVRIGLNAGEPVAEGGDIFGTAVQLAKRICDHAGPGKVLVSDVVRQLVAGKGVEFRDAGKAELKGFSEAAQLYEIVAPQT
jgi:class 3 adenylate cyclase/pimeloyl-ACP methyl ester carboxylesterase